MSVPHCVVNWKELKMAVLSLSALSDEQVRLSVQALTERDEDLARSVCERDRELDQREVEIEEECLKTLALYQPVAADLRLVVAFLKINIDLERIGDLAREHRPQGAGIGDPALGRGHVRPGRR